LIIFSVERNQHNGNRRVLKAPPVSLNMNDLDSDDYDWRRRL